MKYTIDAKGKKLGRVASEAASALMGKKSVSFAKNAVAEIEVEIANAAGTDITALKKSRDVYVTYTGHRGGINRETLGALIERRGMKEVYERAVRRMLPDNKLRERRMKNLTVKE
ncbi:MAG: uL13 family ribosomal protein [Patescibacteria group bacterium]|nr:uL13 family ribosomal protein [Patescibacteria group bacterium]MDE1940766.1 uL13 family ribosomal protein [Patescibacteria group bacterium]MDE1967122.1 uL13 family ribosomal protein [Patescibacteria group bacterium]